MSRDCDLWIICCFIAILVGNGLVEDGSKLVRALDERFENEQK